MQSVVFGPVALMVALVYAYGAVRFCNEYKQGGGDRRFSGYFPRIYAEWTSAALVLACAIKGFAPPAN